MNVVKKIMIAFIPLILGGIIYAIYRTENLKMFKWFKELGVYNEIKKIRDNYGVKTIKMPEWIIYSLPDALWLLSLNFTILIFWKFKINKHSIIWIILTTIIGLYSEIGQYLKIIPGTFDNKDLILLIIAIIVPFLFLKKIKFYNIKSI
jgi:hypothetical protein